MKYFIATTTILLFSLQLSAICPGKEKRTSCPGHDKLVECPNDGK